MSQGSAGGVTKYYVTGIMVIFTVIATHAMNWPQGY